MRNLAVGVGGWGGESSVPLELSSPDLSPPATFARAAYQLADVAQPPAEMCCTLTLPPVPRTSKKKRVIHRLERSSPPECPAHETHF